MSVALLRCLRDGVFIVRVSGLRCLATGSLPKELVPWSEHQWISPPVSFVEGQHPPTALAWLRRRGPQFTQGMIFKLFRKRQVGDVSLTADGRICAQVRSFDGEKVRRVKTCRELKFGDRLLLPYQTYSEKQTRRETPKNVQSIEVRSVPVLDEKLKELAEKSKTWIVYTCKDYFVINKPERIPVQVTPLPDPSVSRHVSQGGEGIRISIDKIYDRLAAEKEWPEAPKLVHRLDNMTTGALILARSSDAASWICQAFRENFVSDVSSARRFTVKKLYYAILDARRMTRTKGDIKTQVQLGTAKLASETYFELVAKKDGLAIVTLRPKTGRKHQLRMHCAFKLDAPILGDRTYSETRKLQQLDAFQSFREQLGDDFLDHMYLHARGLIVKRPSKRPVKVLAPFPDHMQKLIDLIQGTRKRKMM